MPLVNRVLIPEEQINLESGYVETGTIDEKRAEATRRLAVRELLRQRAKQIGIETQDRLDAAIDELLDREVPVPEADEAACRRYFESNRDRFRSPREIEMRHILLAAAPDDAEGRTAARDRADELVAALQADPDRFDELAAAHSRCPSAERGGHLGLVGRGQTVPELENVVLRLPAGLAERPIETRYGFHVVEVLARSGGEPLDYDDVRLMIADYLRERSWRRAVSQYLQVLIADAEISGIDLEADASPLMQ
ncbi:PpiC-type peptidyl-prolyl cis-trans isomerase [Salinisphaera sp. PC39]|uniref:peptidylprolyl isomerase n=1 Tax=Salinisphaera sp. PC39 TaxID=1304156 RepID=UPI00333E65E4